TGSLRTDSQTLDHCAPTPRHWITPHRLPDTEHQRPDTGSLRTPTTRHSDQYCQCTLHNGSLHATPRH
ncbi:Hypothetical predicted protein, partial [Pelobates cultripes]